MVVAAGTLPVITLPLAMGNELRSIGCKGLSMPAPKARPACRDILVSLIKHIYSTGVPAHMSATAIREGTIHTTIADLAQILKFGPTTVARQLKRLHDDGVITLHTSKATGTQIRLIG